MTATPYPLPRETRVSSLLVGNGTAGPYGPTAFKVFDTADVELWAKAASEAIFTRQSGFTVAKTSGAPLDTVSVTAAAVLAPSTQFIIVARRVHERSLAVTKAGTLDSDQLEKELSKQGSVLEELRRDIDRAYKAPFGAAEPAVAAAPGMFAVWDQAGNLVAGAGVAGTLAVPLSPNSFIRVNAAGSGLENVPKLHRLVDTIADMSVLSLVRDGPVRVADSVRGGNFEAKNYDVSAQTTVANIQFATVAADTLSMRTIIVTALDATTNILTAISAHGMTTGEEWTLASAGANGIVRWAPMNVKVVDATRFTLHPNAVAAAGGAPIIDVTGVYAAPLTFTRCHNIRSAEGVMFDGPTLGLAANQRFYAIHVNRGSLSIAATYADARNGVALTLTGSGPVTLRQLKDSEQGIFVTKPTDPMSGLSGAWARSGVKYVTPRMFGADIFGVVPASRYVQAAMNYAKSAGVPLILDEPARYLMDFPVNYITTRGGHYTNRDQGIRFHGEGKQNTAFVFDAAFPTGQSMFNFNGNPDAVDDPAVFVLQGPHTIGGFRIEGVGSPSAGSAGEYGGAGNRTGMTLRAVDGAWIEDIHCFGLSGNGIFVDGVLSATKDDADASQRMILNNCKFELLTKLGFDNHNSRSGNNIISGCEFKVCDGGGVKMAAAGANISGNDFNFCGTVADNTGALALIPPTTAAQSRGYQLNNNMFEAFGKFAVQISGVLGFALREQVFQIYNRGAGQVCVDILNAAGGGSIDNMRVQLPGGAPATIPAINITSSVVGITINNASIADETSNPIVVDALASNIFRDGRPINPTSLRPRFRAFAAAGAVVANVTGDGTDYKSSDYAAGATVSEEYDWSSSHSVATGTFVAPNAGLYRFTARVAAQDFAAGHTSAELALIKNFAGTPVRYLLAYETLVSPGAGRRDYHGSAELLLAAGDTVVWAFKVSGSTKIIDLVRTAAPDTIVFTGAQIM